MCVIDERVNPPDFMLHFLALLLAVLCLSRRGWILLFTCVAAMITAVHAELGHAFCKVI